MSQEDSISFLWRSAELKRDLMLCSVIVERVSAGVVLVMVLMAG